MTKTKSLNIYILFLCIFFLFSCNKEEPIKPELNISPNTDIHFPQDGGTTKITVITNINEWNVNSDKDWCNIDKISNSEFNIRVTKNTKFEPTSPAIITIFANGIEPVLIKVTQDALVIPVTDPAFVDNLVKEYGFISEDGVIYASNPTNRTLFEKTTSLGLSATSEVSSFAGIENFINLKSLNVIGALMTDLDLSYNTSLKYLILMGCNKLTSINISKNVMLSNLDCSGNRLLNLDISNNIALKELRCVRNNLTSLDVSKNIALERLELAVNKLSSIDLSKNLILTHLDCSQNLFQSLDLSTNKALTTLICFSNYLTSINLSNNRALSSLDCYDNNLTILDISKNTALSSLKCYDNNLTDLDISHCRVGTFLGSDPILFCGNQKENQELNLTLTSTQYNQWEKVENSPNNKNVITLVK